jgi:WD40 repeat protein
MKTLAAAVQNRHNALPYKHFWPQYYSTNGARELAVLTLVSQGRYTDAKLSAGSVRLDYKVSCQICRRELIMLSFLRWSWSVLAFLGVGLSAVVGADGSGSNEGSKDESLPPGARAQLGQAHFRHSGQVFSFSFSPDSKKLVTTSIDGVHIWDLSTGREIRKISLEGGNGLNGPGGGPGGGPLPPVPVPKRPIIINNVASQAEFSPDGKGLAVAMPGRPVTIYDPETGKQVREVTDAVIDGNGAAVRFSPDGKQIVVLGRNFQEKSAKVYNVESGKEVRRIEGHEGPVYGACFSNDGKRLVTGSEDATIRIWNTESGKEERVIEGHRSGVFSVAMSADGKYLASAGNDFTVRIWNATSGELLHTYANLQVQNNGFGAANLVQFSSDGKAVIATTATGVYQWDPASGKELEKPKEGTQALFYQSAVSPDGKYLARFNWNITPRVEVFDTKTQKELFPFEAYQVLSLAISPNSKLLATGCSDKVIRLWDLNTAKELKKIEGHTGAVGFLFFTPDGKSLISAARDGSDRFITIWDVQNGKERKSFRGGNMIQAMALSGDGHTLAYKYQEPQGMTLCLMDLEAGKEIRKVPMVGFNQSVALSPDGKLCVYQDQKGETIISDVAEGKNTRTLMAGFAQGFVYSPDGLAVAIPGQQDGLIHLIDTGSGNEIRSFGEKLQGGGIFPPPPGGGKVVPFGGVGGGGIGGGGVANPGAIVRPFFGQMLPVFSVDGRMVATNGPSGILLWEVATGKQRQAFSGADQNVNGMVFSPDGKTLVSSSVSGQVIFWDLAGMSKEEKAEAGKLTAKEAEQLWQDLQGDDGAKAWHAIKVLRAAPKVSVTLLGEKLKPAEGADAKKIEKLIADLDAENFDQRAKASAELERLGDQAEAALRKAQKGSPSIEASQRIDELLQKLSKGSLTGEKLRISRALEVLEQANSEDAVSVLKKIAAGADGFTTDAAKASLQRIKVAKD